MADSSDQILKILVEFGIIGQDKVEQARAAMKSLQTDTGETAKGVNELSDSEEEASKSAELLHKHHHELHQLLHVLGNSIAPGAGRALAAMVVGPLGAVIAFGLIFESVMESVKKRSEEAAAAAKTVWDAYNQGAVEAIERLADFQHSLSQAKQGSDALGDSFKVQLSTLKLIQDALSAINKSTGKTSIDEKAQFSMEEIRAMQSQANQRAAQQADLEANAQAQNETVNKLQGNAGYAGLKQILSTIKREDLVSASGGLSVEDAQKKLAEAQAADRAAAAAGGGPTGNTAFAASKLAAAKRLAQFDSDTAFVNAYDESLKKAKQAFDDQTKAATENATQLKQLNEKIKEAKAKLFADAATGELSQAAAIAKKGLAGGTLSPAEDAYIRTLGTVISGQNVTTAQAEKMFKIATDNQEVMKNFIEDLLSLFENMPNFAAYEKRIADIQKRIDQQP